IVTRVNEKMVIRPENVSYAFEVRTKILRDMDLACLLVGRGFAFEDVKPWLGDVKVEECEYLSRYDWRFTFFDPVCARQKGMGVPPNFYDLLNLPGREKKLFITFGTVWMRN